MSLKQQFISLFENVFLNLEMFQKLYTVKENSPYHREESIGLHTEMVVDRYLEFSPDVWTDEDFHGAIAAAFHDVGKPVAMVKKFKPERGEYLAFTGHEIISARMFEDWASTFGLFMPNEIYSITWMIEHHVPWSLKDKQKREHLALTANAVGRTAFKNMLLADQHGRVSDDQQQKLAQVYKWIEDFDSLCGQVKQRELPDDAPVLFMPIAASGAGKSTAFRGLKDLYADAFQEELVHYSLDNLRHEWYDKDNYENAFRMSTEDSQFETKAKQEFISIVKQKKSVFVDNTNLTKKRRAFYTEEAKRHGYRCIAITLPCQLDLLKARQLTRGDKNVPAEAVERHYMSLQQPFFGEFDTILHRPGNFKIPE